MLLVRLPHRIDVQLPGRVVPLTTTNGVYPCWVELDADDKELLGNPIVRRLAPLTPEMNDLNHARRDAEVARDAAIAEANATYKAAIVDVQRRETAHKAELSAHWEAERAKAAARGEEFPVPHPDPETAALTARTGPVGAVPAFQPTQAPDRGIEADDATDGEEATEGTDEPEGKKTPARGKR